MKKTATALLLFLICFLYFLPGYDKFWHPYDEGFVLEAACMINNGMLPYRDFFILLYPPAQIYVLAFLFKAFGTFFIVARLYTIACQALICLLVFYIGKRFASYRYALFGLMICLSVVSSYGRPIAIPAWPAIALSLSSTLLLLDFIEKEKTGYLISSGLLLGITFLFRHDIGLWTMLSGAAGILLFVMSRARRAGFSIGRAVLRSARALSAYAIFPALFILTVALLLHKNHALGDAVKSLLIFPREFITNADIPFPPFCFNPAMIFHRGSLFIKNDQYYIPILMCAGSALLIFTDIATTKRLDHRRISAITVLALGIFYLQHVIIRTDIPHLAAAIPLSSILVSVSFGAGAENRNTVFRALKAIVLSLVLLFMALLIYASAESYIKDTYAKPFLKKNVKPVAFDRGTMYVPDDGRDAIVSLVNYIKDNTAEDEKIYVGNMDHSVNEFNQYHVLYFLTKRLPAVKYYELHPGLQNKPEVQKEIIGSLEKNGTKLLILRDYGTGDGQGPLDKFIRGHYRPERVIGTCHIYVRR